MQVLYSYTVLYSHTVPARLSDIPRRTLYIHTCSETLQINRVGMVCTRRVADSQMVIKDLAYMTN